MELWEVLDICLVLTFNQILNGNHFVYLKGRSTLVELLDHFNDWAVARKNFKAANAIFLDLATVLIVSKDI